MSELEERVLVEAEIERAVRLQARGYALLQWLEKALKDGFIAPDSAHSFATMEESAYAWMERHYLNLPDAARPAREDLRAFSMLFSTYLLNTFDLDAAPGERLFSPDAHCFCPLCSWMVTVPHLRPKKVGSADKKRAESMKRKVVVTLAASSNVPAPEKVIASLLADPSLRDAIGLFAYAADLLQRLEGIAVGPASLALWRTFAWTREGSPQKGFVLTTAEIMNAQQTLLARLRAGQ